MSESRRWLPATFAFSLIACALAAIAVIRSESEISPSAAAQEKPAAPSAGGKHDPWLKGTADEKFGRVQEHLRGLDIVMFEVSWRYGELLAAAKAKNWEYADYQTKKIRQTLSLGLERRPKREPSAKAFLTEDLPPTLDAIKAKDEVKLAKALETLHNGCIRCHRAEKLEHLVEPVERIRQRAAR